jgi:DNA polymerase I-like protein with 3'-5' exonuclease and polymerase domains
MSRESRLIDIIKSGKDVYCEFGGSVFGRAITKADTLERLIAKIACLSLGYGAGAKAYRNMLFTNGGIVRAEEFCAAIVDKYRSDHANIKRAWYECRAYVESVSRGGLYRPDIDGPFDFQRDGVVMPSGFKVKYYDVRAEPRGYSYLRHTKEFGARANLYHGVVVENINQAIARDVVMYMHTRIEKELKHVADMNLALQVHDELVYVVPDRVADICLAEVSRIMRTPPVFWPDLHVGAEAGFAKSYVDCKG